jgi:hypothetical protein
MAGRNPKLEKDRDEEVPRSSMPFIGVQVSTD